MAFIPPGQCVSQCGTQYVPVGYISHRQSSGALIFVRIHIAITSAFRRLSKEEEGATAVEYGLIVGLIAVVLVVAVGGLSGALGDMFDSIKAVLEGTLPAKTAS